MTEAGLRWPGGRKARATESRPGIARPALLAVLILADVKHFVVVALPAAKGCGSAGDEGADQQ